MLAPRTICAACRSRLASSLARPMVHGNRGNGSGQQFSTTQAPRSGFSRAAPPTATEARSSPRSNNARGTRERTKAKNRALDLFESTVNAGHDADSKLDIDGLLRHANRLETVLRREKQGDSLPSQSAEECLSIVVDGVLEIMSRGEGGRLPRAVQQSCEKAMKRVLQVKFSAHGGGLPSAAALCKILSELDSKHPGRLDPYVALLDYLVSHTEAVPGQGPAQAPFDQQTLDALLECWEDVAAARYIPSDASQRASPSPRWRQKEPAEVLRNDFPNLVRDSAVKLIIALVGTHAVLCDPRAEALRQKPSFESSTSLLGTLIKKLDPSRLEPYFSDHPLLWQLVSPTVARLIEENPPVQEVAEETRHVKGNKRTGPTEPQKPEQVSYAAWHKRLNLLFKSNDTRGLLAAWRDLTEPRNDPNRAAKLRQCPELFDFIIYQCCRKYGAGQQAFRELNERVLSYMKQIHLQPTLKTFTSMMEGWKIARRFDRIDALWNQLAASNFTLDQHIWSSRISACGALGRPYDGIKALEEMNQLWQTAQASKDAAVRAAAVRPGTASVNAAIAGLLRADNVDAVQTVLAWAADKDIEPDVYTYNTMLAYMLKKGLVAEADRLLNSMKARGVSPDGATFTIILDTAMVEMNTQSPAEQRNTIARIFADMATCGLTPNLETYAKMLHILTRCDEDAPLSEDHAQSAIDAVLDHLRRAGLQLSPEICTILFEFHAARGTERDEEAIRALIAERRTRTRVLPDRVFWETVMRHFNHRGDTAAALEVFYDMDDWGIWPALPVMEPILRSLARQGRWDEARKLVDAVRAQARPAATDPGGRYWKHAFWAVAKEHGLMGEAQAAVE